MFSVFFGHTVNVCLQFGALSPQLEKCLCPVSLFNNEC